MVQIKNEKIVLGSILNNNKSDYIKPISLIYKSGFFYLRFESEDLLYNFSKLNPKYLKSEWAISEYPRTKATKSLRAAALLYEYGNDKTKALINQACSCDFDIEEFQKRGIEHLKFLDPHQIEGVKWILSRKRSYLAHAPGAGKTATAIVASQLTWLKGQTLFIVPPSLTKNWEREIYKFTEFFDLFPTIGIIQKSDKKEQTAWRADFIICPDSMLTKPWVYEKLKDMKKNFIAVDEASRFKNPKSDRSLGLYGGRGKKAFYSGLFQKAEHVVFLDGSPMPNKPMELWAPTSALDPEAIDFMTEREFGHAYCGAHIGYMGTWVYDGSNNEKELHSKLKNRFMHVVLEAELKHPERKRSMLVMSEDVRTNDMREWEKKNISYDNDNGASGSGGNRRQRQRREYTEGESIGELANHRRLLGLRKCEYIADYVKDRLTRTGESILLFVWHREVALDLKARLLRFAPMVVIGGVGETEREQHFKDFQKGRGKLIIGNISAMGRGHNLQKADRIIFGEYSWTDELNKQCEKRASRRGRDESLFVRCEYIVCPESIDERVLTSVFTKAKRVSKIIEGVL